MIITVMMMMKAKMKIIVKIVIRKTIIITNIKIVTTTCTVALHTSNSCAL